MLLLLAPIAGQLYCIRATSVVEVIPRVPLQSVVPAPVTLAGLLHYRGEIIPVLDLRALLGDGASDAFLSTRIVVVECANRRVGLIAERLTETLDVDASALVPAPVETPFLGGLIVHEGQVIRELLVDRMPVGAVA